MCTQSIILVIQEIPRRIINNVTSQHQNSSKTNNQNINPLINHIHPIYYFLFHSNIYIFKVLNPTLVKPTTEMLSLLQTPSPTPHTLKFSSHKPFLISYKLPRVFPSAILPKPISAVISGIEELRSEELLPVGLERKFMPKHVAVIMDGNVRWARKNGLAFSLGHEAGVRALRNLIELCCRWGIKVLSVFAFSCDNWNRPKMEVEFLMSLFERGIQAEVDNFMREDIRVSVIGDSSKLPNSLKKLIANTEEVTKNNLGLQLIVAVSYSGQYDIVQACQNIAYKVKEGSIEPESINECLIKQELETNCTKFPYPDLLIRTSGELRVSNFLLWQLAYTELCFVQSLWPDFGEAEFIEALQSFQRRQRRYGRRDCNR